SALDRHYQADWQEMSRYRGRRHYLQRTGHATYRLRPLAGDPAVLGKGKRRQGPAPDHQPTERGETPGPAIKPEKTGITHIDDGFLFLGLRIIRRPKGAKQHVYTFVSDEALASVKRKVKALTGRSTTYLELPELLRRLNPILRGWAAYFRYAA